jgi:SpoVK/Ycf46/Vps4 family AAA+-type ATPase
LITLKALDMSSPDLLPVTTDRSWDDLALPEDIVKQVEQIKAWLRQSSLISHTGTEKKLTQGYRSLFYGPQGSGKKLTAALIGKEFDKPVYKIDLSNLVSKYIGETEKNLEILFDRAEGKEWILFFDEADALFGERTGVKDAHDRYSNQEVSYLLQRIEDYNGLVILATNMKSNIDEAFIRRFNLVIRFPLPKSS